MTVLSRGARSRRGARGPGWLLLTALLVLAIAASSALVFTNRIELLKLAVVLALWAAVVAAFVSVIYRRQADADAARARDLKLVYDLQLDREISARREYELTVESQLRRELASELRAQAADEVAALRAELAALRTNLEILFETELADRPAIETERTTVRAYSDWARDPEVTDPGHGASARFIGVDFSENGIIDVPEEPLVRRQGAEGQPVSEAAAPGRRHARDHGAEGGPEDGGWSAPAEPPHEPEPAGRHGAADGEWQPVAAEGQWLPPGLPGSNWVSSANGDVVDHGPIPGQHAPPPGGRHASAGDAGAATRVGVPAGAEWAGAGGESAGPAGEGPISGSVAAGQVSEGFDPGSGAEGPVSEGAEGPVSEGAEGPVSEGAEGPVSEGAEEPVSEGAEEPVSEGAEEPVSEGAEEPVGPGRDEAPVHTGQHGEGQGQSVAELLARLQATPVGGGRRRRRED